MPGNRRHSSTAAVNSPPTIEGGTDRHSLSFGDDEHTLSRVTRATTGKRRSGPTRSTCYGNSCARPAFAVRGARNVLMWLMFGLAVWLSVGALTAQLFGAFVSGGRHSSEPDEDDQNASSSVR